MKKGTVLVLGANSDIAQATAHKFADSGHSIQLAVRDTSSMKKKKKDFELRYRNKTTVHKFDALDSSSHMSFVDGLPELPDIVVCAVGFMPDQSESENDMELASRVFRSNFEGPAQVFSILANKFVERGHGTLVGISSVAGERGRATNYVYGSAKAGFTAFLSGLRNRLSKTGVHVVTVLPGFVATRMTEGMDLPRKLTAQPEEVADAIAKAVTRKKNVVYVRRIWWLIMTIIRSIPEFIFKKLKI